MLPKPGQGAMLRRYAFDFLIESIIHGQSALENIYCPARIVARTGCGRHLSCDSLLSWNSWAHDHRGGYGAVEPGSASISLRDPHATAVMAMETRDEVPHCRPVREPRSAGVVRDRDARVPMHARNCPADPIHRGRLRG